MENYTGQPQTSPTGPQWLQDNAFSQSTMQDWIHAFPRPRHTRVMKPRSAGNSPSSVGKRRTTVAQGAMHAPSSQYQSSLQAALLASALQNPRPTSWHPSSGRSRGLSNGTWPPDFAAEDYASIDTLPPQPMTSMPVYGSDTTLSYPLSAESSYSPGYYPAYSGMDEAMSLPQQTPTSNPGSQVEAISWDITGSNAYYPTMNQLASDSWSLDMFSMANIPSAETTCPSYASVPSPGEVSGPSTPDFLPIQQFDDKLESQDNEDGKGEELVGMGLYSQPDGSFAQRHHTTMGRGLKLEETFSPDQDQDEETAEGTENASTVQPTETQTPLETFPSILEQPTFSAPKQSSRQPFNLLHKSFFFDHDDLDHQAMTAAQPFASLNQSCMNYGYGWI